METDNTVDDEAWISHLLHARAERITVLSDIAAVTAPPRESARRAQTWPWWIAAAAVVLVGALLAAPDFPDPGIERGGTSDLSTDLSEFAAPAGEGEQFLVWMHVEATPEQIQSVSLLLGRIRDVDGYTYFDREASYQEFSDYYADKPEILELVRPEQLPTYFVVTTDDPIGVADRLEGLPGVSETEQPADGD